MTKVSKEQFFKYVNDRDITVHALKNECVWKTRAGYQIGRTTPGYDHCVDAEKEYFLRDDCAKEVMS